MSKTIKIDADKIDWDKGNGLVPAIIQDADNYRVLMLGYMNRDSLDHTLKTKKVTFFSRSKEKLWTKGEESGNFLNLVSIEIDCDQDTLLVQARPEGPTCHKGTDTCFGKKDPDPLLFINELSSIIKARKKMKPKDSYVAKLFKRGREKISQKVGEEGVELALAHMTGNKKEIKEEAADLLFHTLMLLENEKLSLADVCKTLKQRQKI